MVRVKLSVPICGPEGSFKAGDKPDLPEALAKALIKDGHAKNLEIIEIKKELPTPPATVLKNASGAPEKPKKEEPLKRKSTRQRR